MTSILMFLVNKGNQMVVVGDTQHTYIYSTKEESKLSLFGKLLFCASGYDKIIWYIYPEINNLKSLASCSKKVVKLAKEKKDEFTKTKSQSSFIPDDVDSCEFMLIDSNSLKAKTISKGLTNDVKNLEVIGSGNNFIGEIQRRLGNCYEFPFGSHLFKNIVEIFCYLGRNDPLTGHPALFSLETYLLEKNKPPQKFVIKFKLLPEAYENYEVKLEND